MVGEDEIILDVDPRNGSDVSLDYLTAQHGDLPGTVTTCTRGKGRHLRFKLPQGVEITGHYEIAKGLDVLGRGCNVVLAGTSGYEYELENGPDEIEVAEAPRWLLDLIVAEQVTRRQKDIIRRLPDRIHVGERNETIFRLLCSLRSQGADETKLADFAENVNQQHCIPPLSGKEISTIVRSVAHYKVGSARNWQEIQAARATIDAIRQAVLATPWRGKDGATRRALLLGVLSLAYERGSLTIRCSVRQIAQHTRVGSVTDTSGRSLRRINRYLLSLSPWLERLSVGRGNVSSTYYLCKPLAHATQELTVTIGAGTTNVSPFVASHDVWGWRGLGKNAELVWNSLAEDEISAQELSEQLSMSKRTVERQLAKLRKHGLGIRGEKGWKRGAGTLDEVAERLGVLGYGGRLHETYESERREYRKKCPLHFSHETISPEEKEGNLKTVSKIDHSHIETPPSSMAEEPPAPVWEEELLVSPVEGASSRVSDDVLSKIIMNVFGGGSRPFSADRYPKNRQSPGT